MNYMKKTEANRFVEMDAFVKVVELSGFSAAARFLQKSPSAISKIITRLEDRLQVQLFNRSTRQLQLTAEGEVFYQQCLQVLTSVEQAEQSLLLQKQPMGQLRVSCNRPVGRHLLLPLVPAFIKQYPAIQLDIDLTDRVVDLIDEYTDIAIRSGPMKNSNLRARFLGNTQMVVVAAPSYLSANKKPTKPQDLKQHRCLGFNYARAEKGWPFVVDGCRKTFPIIPALTCSDGEALHQCAVEGAGIARLALFQVAQDIAAGRLVPLLKKNDPKIQEQLHAVFLGQGNHMPARIRAFLDYLIANVQLK
ncbi:MAG: LysR family transcriptional regulator [Coxiellaceae bacterium]|nr:LysR family transcriptional regulator [Coxiellaceae bacterium]